MEKFGIEIIDPTGNAPVRAFIGADDFLWEWMTSRTSVASAGEVLSGVPEGYCVKDGALVPGKGTFDGDVRNSVVLDIATMVVTKVNMVAKGLKEVPREQFRKENVPDSRIIAVIPI